MTNQELITKVTQVIQRMDGSEVKIVATAMYGLGLNMSIATDVFKRIDSNSAWVLLNDKPSSDWLGVDDYIKNGRSEKLQAIKPIELLKVINLIGKPLSLLGE